MLSSYKQHQELIVPTFSYSPHNNYTSPNKKRLASQLKSQFCEILKSIGLGWQIQRQHVSLRHTTQLKQRATQHNLSREPQINKNTLIIENSAQLVPETISSNLRINTFLGPSNKLNQALIPTSCDIHIPLQFLKMICNQTCRIARSLTYSLD